MLVNIPSTHDVQSHDDVSVPLFKNKFLDKFSRVYWFIPILLFMPIISYFIYLAVTTTTLSAFAIAGYFFLGLITWTAAEYFFHRYVFHYTPKSELGHKFFYLIHGIHHAYPADSMRLVMPPAMSIPLSLGFYFLFTWTLGTINLAFFPGFLLGYVLYDTMHYAIHHFHFIKHPWFLKIKKHHMRHHFAEPELGFGVSSDLWDKVMRTTFNKEHAQ